jgi:hypothetical protein
MCAIVGNATLVCAIRCGACPIPPLKRKHVMKPIVALMITGLLASAAALADQPVTVAQAPATPAATAPSGAAPTGDQPAKKQAHHKKKTHKSTMAKAPTDKAPTDTKKSDTKPATEMAKPATPPSDMKK